MDCYIVPPNLAIGCQLSFAKIEIARYAIGRLPTMHRPLDLGIIAAYTIIASKTMPVQINGLEANLQTGFGSMSYDDLVERRTVPRIASPFVVTIRGVDETGDRFRIDTVLENFSAAGLFLRLMRPIELDATVLVVVRFAVAPGSWLNAPGVAAHGVVVWIEPQLGAWGIAIKFTRQRFLYAAAT